MKVILLSGKARHGKDTVATMMKEALEDDGYNVLVTSYADLLKYICKQFFGWNGKKDEAGRGILQYVGTDVVRSQEPDFWVDFILKILKLFPDEWDYVIIPDCRFPNEIDVLRDAGLDVTHIRVIRQDFKSPLTLEQQKHLSEVALDHYHPDEYLLNDGDLIDLRNRVNTWCFDKIGFHQLCMDEFR